MFSVRRNILHLCSTDIYYTIWATSWWLRSGNRIDPPYMLLCGIVIWFDEVVSDDCSMISSVAKYGFDCCMIGGFFDRLWRCVLIFSLNTLNQWLRSSPWLAIFLSFYSFLFIYLSLPRRGERNKICDRRYVYSVNKKKFLTRICQVSLLRADYILVETADWFYVEYLISLWK